MSDDRRIIVIAPEALLSGFIGSIDDPGPIRMSGSGLVNVEFRGSGGTSVSGVAEIRAIQFFSQKFPWNIGGNLDFGFTSSWNVGTGEFYWYRVESECGTITCEVNDVRYTDCPNMTVVTMVAARSVSEVCRTLRSPSYTSSAKMRIRSMAKYSRPVARANIVEGTCNELEEQEFCQSADCLDYCIDQNILVRAGLDMSAVEQKTYEMSGSITLSGRILKPTWYYEFEPSGSFVIDGVADADISFHFASLSDLKIRGSAELPGFLANVLALDPPYRPTLRVNVRGSARLAVSSLSEVILSLSGSASVSVNNTFNLIFKGGFRLDGSGMQKYGESLGILKEVYRLAMTVADIGVEYLPLPETNTLTAGSEAVPVTCGCGPLAQLVYVTHNLEMSKVFGSFVERNNLSVPYRSPLRYRAVDRSWRLAEHYSGISMKEPGIEDWTLFMSLSCSANTWNFSFRIQSQNRLNSRVVKSQFSVDIPSSSLCVNNNVSTVLNVDVTPFQNPASGVRILVVEGGRNTSIPSRGVSASTFGSFVELKSFADELGIFGDSYWQRAPFQIRINSVTGEAMPSLEVGSIIPTEPIFPA